MSNCNQGSISNGLPNIEGLQVLTEISRENHVYCVHTMSATVMPVHLKDGTYIQLTITQYDQYCPRIRGVNVHNIFSHIVPVSPGEKAHYTEHLPQHV